MKKIVILLVVAMLNVGVSVACDAHAAKADEDTSATTHRTGQIERSANDTRSGLNPARANQGSAENNATGNSNTTDNGRKGRAALAHDRILQKH